MTEKVYQLAYVSSAKRPLYAPDLRELLQAARARNEANGVTGMLLYKSERFMQVLEGREQDVESIFSSIRADARHHRIWTLFSMPTSERNFARWSMGCYLLETGTVIEIDGGTEVRELDDARLQSDESIARALLQKFADGSQPAAAKAI